MRRSAVVACAVVILGSSVACGGSSSDKAGGGTRGEPLTLSLAAYAQPDPDEFVAAVDNLSEGSIRIKTNVLWRDGQLDFEEATIADVERGSVDLAVVSARAFDVLGATSFQGLLAPFLVDSLALQRRVLEGKLREQMLAEVDALGVVGLGLLPGPLRRPVGITRPLVAVEEYPGATIGVRASRLIEKTFQTLGSSTKPALFPRDFRVIDGAEYDLTALDFSRYDEQASSIAVNVVFWPRPVVVIANQETFAGLTSQQRELLRNAASAALAPAFDRVAGNERSALASVCARAEIELVRASPSQLAALHRAAEPVYDELRRDPLTRRVIADIESLRSATPAETLRCPGSDVRSDQRAEELDGTWQWSVTRKELLAAGDTPAGAGRNTGRWRLVLDRGRFELRSLDVGDVYRGTYSVEGNRVLARVVGTPAVLEYTWNIYRGRLTFGRVGDGPVAAVLVVKPLTRAG